MTQSDFDVRIQRALGSPEFARAEQGSRSITRDAAGLRSLVVRVEQMRLRDGMCAASHVEFDIACAVVEARIETLEAGVPGDNSPSDLSMVLAALTFAVESSGPTADGEAMVHWAVGVGLGRSGSC